MMEQWHPLGPIGVISAFNFPVAVWAWNAMLALVCGDTVVWKPSEKTPLSAIACQALVDRAVRRAGFRAGGREQFGDWWRGRGSGTGGRRAAAAGVGDR